MTTLVMLALVNPPPDDLVTSQQLLLAGLGTLATVVGVLWKQLSASIKDLQRRVNDCEADRARLWEEKADRAAR